MKLPTIETIDFRGGRLCLDFVNTANWVDDHAVDDRLIDIAAVRTWVERKQLSRPSQLDGDLSDLLTLRDAMRQVLIHFHSASLRDINILNSARNLDTNPLHISAGRLKIRPGSSLNWLIRALADSVSDLVLNTDQSRIKICHGDRCGWLFVDESPNNRRRWCSMAECGNRAKAKRHYHAAKAEK